mgnify:FL=1
MKRKSIFLIITIFTLIVFSACDKKEIVKEDNEITPLFYKISDKNNTTIYLLGSIHAADDTIYPLNDTIMNSFNDSDYLAVEVDTLSLQNNFDLSLKLAEKMMYNDSTTIKNHIGDELYNKMVNFLKEKKSYSSLYDNYKPVFFESLFENLIIDDAMLKSESGIDMYFLSLASENNKKILEVESAEFQYNLLLNTPLELDKIMIEEYIDNYDLNVSQMKDLYELWKKGDKEQLENILINSESQNATEEEKKLMENYNQSLIIDRNYGMANVLENYFEKKQNVFCVVGLGHVIGDEGIINLLQKRGYDVAQLN